jgi:DHA2 family multidrug resistance protein-like MFS transporter
VVLAHFWWGAVFLLAVPVMALLLVLGPLLLPEFRDPNAGRLDLRSAGLSIGAVLAVIYGMKRLAEDGMHWPPLFVILAGLGLGALFLRRQKKLADPLIDLRLFRTPAFSAALTINTLGFFAMFSAFLYIAQYLQLVLGLNPLEAGLWTVPSALAFIVGSFIAPALAHRVHPAFIMAGGLIVGGMGFAILSQLTTTSPLSVLVVGSVIFSLGLTPVVSMTTDLIVGSAPPERAGAASAISETSSEFGGALGIAVLGSVAAAIYRNEMMSNLPAGLPAAAIEAARGTMGSAAAVAARLPGELGLPLLEAARHAFVSGLQVSAAISMAVAIAAALVAATALRRAKTASA